MTIRLVDTTRHAGLSDISTKIDAGAAGGTLDIRTLAPGGTKGTDAGTSLAVVTFNAVSFGAPSAGAMVSATTTDSAAATAGTAGHFVVKDSNGVFVFDGTVTATGGGGDLILTTVTIGAGVILSIPSITLTAGNP